jgi:uncharacterized protein (TIGR02001 family)
MASRFILWCAFALSCLLAGSTKASELSGEIGLVSDYRYRGISISNGKPALQGSVTLEHDNGLYVQAWASTIGGPDVDANAELDLTAGYSLELADNLGLEIAGTYYLYPGEAEANYVDGTMSLELTHGQATAHLGFSFAPKQQGTKDEQGEKHANGYAFAGLSYEFPKLPLTINAELGYEQGAFDEAPIGGKWDWRLGGEAKLGRCRLGLAYVGTDFDASNDGVVASLFLDF